MCNVCYAQKNGWTAISVKPSSLCDNHYQDWCAEKALGEDWYF